MEVLFRKQIVKVKDHFCVLRRDNSIRLRQIRHVLVDNVRIGNSKCDPGEFVCITTHILFFLLWENRIHRLHVHTHTRLQTNTHIVIVN